METLSSSSLVSDETVVPDNGVRASRGRTLIVTLILLLLLALCSWCLLWPVPDGATIRGGASKSRFPVRRGDLLVEVADVRDTGAEVGSKGRAVRVGFSVANRGPERFLTASSVKLQIDATELPALGSDAGGGGSTIPSVLPAGETVAIEAVFAVPLGAQNATLSVEPIDVSPADAGRASVDLRAGDEQ